MKKSLLILSIIGILASFAVFAEDGVVVIDDPLGNGTNSANATFETIIGKLIDFIFSIAVVLFPLMIVVGGFMLFSSGGDSKKVDNGKKIITYAMIGFVVILLAKAFMGVLESTIGLK